MLAGSATSSSTACMPGLAAITASRWLRRRPAMMTLLPSLCSASARPRPMPEPPPVIKMVLPVSFMCVLLKVGSSREAVAEHRPSAFGFGSGGFVLQHVPVLGELAVFDAQHVGGDPCGRSAVAGEAAVHDHVVAFGQDQAVLVAQAVGNGADQVEQAIATRLDMRAVLDVAGGP